MIQSPTDVTLIQSRVELVGPSGEDSAPRTACEVHFAELSDDKTVLIAACTDLRSARPDDGGTEVPRLRVRGMFSLVVAGKISRRGTYKDSLRELIRPFFHDFVCDMRGRARMPPPSMLLDFDSFEISKVAVKIDGDS